MERIEGTIEDIVYRNDDNGYTVLRVLAAGIEVTVVGLMFGVTIGEHIIAEGTYTSHNIYGQQLKVTHIETNIPTETAAIERYLGSGAIKGIRISTAKKIVKKFGEETFHIMENDPLELAEIKGISQKKAQSIGSFFYEQRTMRQGVIFLQEYGVSLTYAVKIFNQYKEKTYEVIKSNPYLLAEDIQGISFRIADEIAKKAGIEATSEFRIMAAIKFVLYQSSIDGHTYQTSEELIAKTTELLMIEGVDYVNLFIQLQLSGSIVIEELEGEERVYLSIYDRMEKYIAAKLFDLTHIYEEKTPVSIEEIKHIESDMGISFDSNQIEAISKSLSSGTLVITGGPGTGKTTTLNGIIQCLEDAHQLVLLAAPTGRAAKRMSETTGKEAKTIHRLLEINSSPKSKQSFQRNEDHPLECDVVIIDEISMIDTHLMYHLLKALVPGSRLICVGDQDQLPSVGPGNILKDIIGSGHINTVKLKRIFRQAGESHIVTNAHKINSGEMIDLHNNKKDFFFIRRRESQQIIRELITLVKERLPKFAGFDTSDGIQILTPTRKGVLGVDQLNNVLQKTLNPPNKKKIEKEYRGHIFREKDKVMQIKNNYNIPWEITSEYGYQIDEGVGVFNGDMGVIEEINLYTEKIRVVFDDQRTVVYDFKGLDELELAYAVTIHKSQGSEYPVVVMPLFKGPTMLLNRNLLYTGITRARQYVVLVGDGVVVEQMINNNQQMQRHSGLKIRIIEMFRHL